MSAFGLSGAEQATAIVLAGGTRGAHQRCTACQCAQYLVVPEPRGGNPALEVCATDGTSRGSYVMGHGLRGAPESAWSCWAGV